MAVGEKLTFDSVIGVNNKTEGLSSEAALEINTGINYFLVSFFGVFNEVNFNGEKKKNGILNKSIQC